VVKHIGTVLLAALCISVPVHAGLFTDEAFFPGGDFPAAGFPNIGTLGGGVNSIHGFVAGSPNGGDFEDTFSLTLPTAEDFGVTGGLLFIARFSFGAGAFDFAGSVTEPLNGTSTINTANNGLGLGPPITLSINAALPGGQTINIDIKSPYSCADIECSSPMSGGFEYDLQYSGTSLPEPGTWALMALGLLAPWGNRYLRRTCILQRMRGAPLSAPRSKIWSSRETARG
jgi:hypothetical protein